MSSLRNLETRSLITVRKFLFCCSIIESDQINKIMLSIHDTKRKFRGVFASDMLPKTIQLPSSLIANFDSSMNPRSHWISIFITRKKMAEYIDSYAGSPLVSLGNNWRIILKPICTIKFDYKYLWSVLLFCPLSPIERKENTHNRCQIFK
jgi:hypothetical protein